MKPLVNILVGHDSTNTPHYINFHESSHVVIAGCTGTGKSTFLCSMMDEIIKAYPKDRVKFVLIDPKQTGFSGDENPKNLLKPTITISSMAVETITELRNEMERRYDYLISNRVQSIQQYHSEILDKYTGPIENAPDTMPFIFLMVDEFSDLMHQHGEEVEKSLIPLMQISRRVGIFSILSTSKPSETVFTNSILNNATACVAFQLASKEDSERFLGWSGAENLNGAGDMLFWTSKTDNTVRLQALRNVI